jgi:hypothetical protein
MKKRGLLVISIFIFMLLICGCQNSNNMNEENSKKILFLHHSTGKTIWQGGNNFSSKVNGKLGMRSAVEKWFDKYNRQNLAAYEISDIAFPAREPYGWKNYPFDYYNIWVKNGDQDDYQKEPTLKALTPKYDLIIFKHCFPASKIVFDGVPDIDSERKMVENYKLQYEALKMELHKYPETRFLIWTPPALPVAMTSPEAAEAASGFSRWVVNDWNQPGDNIFIWDFRSLETGGGNYLLPRNAAGEKDAHPSGSFAKSVYPLFCKRVVEVLENHGDGGSTSGQ